MDEQTKELAKRIMKTAAEKNPSTGKFSVQLPESQQQATAMLLGYYGAAVESRGMEFLMDDVTLSKVERVMKWMYESRKRGLLLCGTLGNGKTTMLRAISRMFGMHSLLMEAQSVYDFFRQNQSLPVVAPKTLLLIDDLGAEPSSYNDFGEMRYPLTELLLQRYKTNSPTVIATNLTFDQIGQTYGDRLQDRMREMFAMISYLEPSYRK